MAHRPRSRLTMISASDRRAQRLGVEQTHYRRAFTAQLPPDSTPKSSLPPEPHERAVFRRAEALEVINQPADGSLVMDDGAYL